MLTSIGWVSRAERAAEDAHNEDVRRKDEEMAQQKQRVSDLLEDAESAANNFSIYSSQRRQRQDAFQSLRNGGPGLYGRRFANPEPELVRLEFELDALALKVEDSRRVLRDAVRSLYAALEPLGVRAPPFDMLGAATAARSICLTKGIAVRPLGASKS